MGNSDHTGKTLDERYRLLNKIGEGGMGAVYLAHHVVIGRKVAVKLLRVEFASSKQIVKRFYREAHAAASIKHRNIIDIFDLGISPWGEPYLVMEYLEGESLGTLLDRHGPIDLAASCAVLESTLQALSAAHDAGVIHRDLKPENIFLVHDDREDPIVKLIDFGISKFAYEGDQTRLTQTGSLLGTPDFMSPEQARGKGEIDHRADIWGIGVILYECLTLARPFVGESYNDLILNILSNEPTPPSEVDPECPPEVDDIVMRALEKDPDNRYQTAAEMLDALKELSCFEERKQSLIRYADDMSELCFASGDLGADSVTLPLNVAEKVLDELVREKTPGGWSWTGRREGRRSRLFLAIVGVVVLIGLGSVGAGYYYFSRDGGPAKPTAAEGSVSQDDSNEAAEDEGVEITLEGVPEDAKIYYQDALVPMNPFRVDKKTTIMPIRVEAEGYEIFSIMVVPSEDKKVEVTLEKRPSRASKTQSKSSPPSSAGRSTDSKAAVRAKAMESISKSIGLKSETSDVLTPAQQRIVYIKNKRHLKRCYDQALARGDAPASETLSINMKLDVSSSGNVLEVSLSGSGASVPWLNDCLKREAMKWEYPESAEETAVKYSFAFAPKE